VERGVPGGLKGIVLDLSLDLPLEETEDDLDGRLEHVEKSDGRIQRSTTSHTHFDKRHGLLHAAFAIIIL
jgi:acyl-coenzyme A thioesterase PaaI-like protein